MDSNPNHVAAVPVDTALSHFAERFDARLSAMLADAGRAPLKLVEAMSYSLLAPGKRLRPFVVVRCCEVAGGSFDDALAAAAAVEMVHAFSLIHDDLPAMDDDDMRRGRPTNHKVFGEAAAILAGDALLTLAFETLARRSPPHVAARLVAELAAGSGWCGMIGGQIADLEGETLTADAARVQFIHEHKTAALFASAARMGAICAGAAGDMVARLGEFGRHMGLAFQIADDLLDLTASAGDLGKEVKKDATRRKQTYPACVGLEMSRTIAERAVEEAIRALEAFGPEAEDLRSLARFAVDRRS